MTLLLGGAYSLGFLLAFRRAAAASHTCCGVHEICCCSPGRQSQNSKVMKVLFILANLFSLIAAFSSGSPSCDNQLPPITNMAWAGRNNSVQYELVSAAGTYTPGISSTLSLQPLSAVGTLLELRGFEIHAEQNGARVGNPPPPHEPRSFFVCL